MVATFLFFLPVYDKDSYGLPQSAPEKSEAACEPACG